MFFRPSVYGKKKRGYNNVMDLIKKPTVTDEGFVRTLFPKRKRNTHKGDYGTLVIIGGCRNYPGAPLLSAAGAAALRAGCGLVKLGVPESLISALQQRVTEVSLFPLPEKEGFLSADPSAYLELTARATAVVFGPGIGIAPQTEETLRLVYETVTAPLLLDADALNLFAKTALPKRKGLLITPHLGEMSRLCGITPQNIRNDRIRTAENFARERGLVLLMQDDVSVATDGEKTFLVESGTPAMAKGGSGDLLSGIVGSLCARGIPLLSAAAAGAFLAGKAAENAVKHSNEYSLLASDTATELRDVLTEILHPRFDPE